jgi:hypothetical protein
MSGDARNLPDQHDGSEHEENLLFMTTSGMRKPHGSGSATISSIWWPIVDWASRKALSRELPITADQYVSDEDRLRYGDPQIFETDQGSQFTCSGFVAPLPSAGVRKSTDGKGGGPWIA